MSVKTIVSNTDPFKIDENQDMHTICEQLAHLILNNYAYQIIDNIIHQEYFYFSSDEQMFLKEKARINFANSDKQLIEQYLQKELFQYLEENDYLNLYGFIIFRAEQFTQYLQLTVDEVIGEYLNQLETDELIDYLKKYLSTQKPLIQTLHIISDKNHQYTVLNDEMKQILSICKYDDLLLNAVISIAPETVCMYGNLSNTQLKHIFSKIFQDHILFYDQYENQ